MATRHTVTIDGREFQVKHRQEPGGLGRTKKQLQAARAASAATVDEMFDAVAKHVDSYLESGDLPWLLDHLPLDANDILRQCIEAAGGSVAETKPGEAGGQ